ncbi:MAG: alpha/beta hydrolase [Verrucomicrobia bacterium]|nr:alpha/beta hydrolase [Verrucomicrobiota bacterium]
MINQLVVVIVVLSVLNFEEAQQPGGKSVSKGVPVHRDLEYIKKGHERQKHDPNIPKADSPTALIVRGHRGAQLAGDKAGPPALALTSGGYALGNLNNRLSQHTFFPVQIENSEAGLGWLRDNAKSYNIDPNRVGLWGSSAGGQWVALSGTSGNMEELEEKPGNGEAVQSNAEGCRFSWPNRLHQHGWLARRRHIAAVATDRRTGTAEQGQSRKEQSDQQYDHG